MIEDEKALAELDVHDAKLEELDIEGVPNYATHTLQNAAKSWIQCSSDQKQNSQRVLFPDGLVFDGESYRTAPTCIAFFQLLAGNFRRKNRLASRTGIEPVSPP